MKKWVYVVLAVVGLSVCIPQDSYAKKIYVSTAGSDENAGTKTAPYRTIQKGVDSLHAGDTLYIGGGKYNEEVVVSKQARGKAGKYTTIRNIEGQHPVLSGEGLQGAILMQLYHTSYIKVQGLEFSGLHTTESCGLYVDGGSHHLSIAENVFHDIAVPNPTKKDACCNAILLFGDNSKRAIHHVQIKKNKIYDCATGWAEALSVTGNCEHINIEKNVLKNTGNIGIDLSGNYGYCKKAAKDFPRNCTVKGNKVYDCISPNATSYGIYVDGGQHIIISDNLVKGCSGGIEIGAEEKPKKEKYCTRYITVKKNKIYNNIENGITVGGYFSGAGMVKDCEILNNTLKNNGGGKKILLQKKSKRIHCAGNKFK